MFTRGMEFDLGEDVNALRDTVHRWAQDRIKPIAGQVDRSNEFPAALWREMGDLGHVDPARVVEGIVGGIGLLGTGAIIQSRGQVVGATTGATIWVVGAIGLACGFGLYMHATLVAAISFFVLAVLGLVTRRLAGRKDPIEPQPPPAHDRDG